MKSVNFRYRTELMFSSPASAHRFTLRILPKDDGRQRIKNLQWSVDPSEALWRSRDNFGNDALSGYADAPHEYFRFGIEGSAEMSEQSYVICDDYERVLLYPTTLTRAHGGLVGFYEDVCVDLDGGEGGVERVKHFSNAVHNHIKYERGITSSTTTAQEAFDGGIGVCQDFTHILLALLRLDKIPCRYVAGLASDYGETHAWVEAWICGKYYGVDPTRNKFIDGGYIALSRGRDFEDCAIERGIFKGACRGAQTISVNMEAEQ